MPPPTLARHTLLAAFTVVALLLLSWTTQPTIAAADGEDASESHQRGESRKEQIQSQIRGCVNRKRTHRGLPPLQAAGPLEEAASLHASSMSKHGFFDHVDPRGRDAGDRVAIFARKSRYLPIGENIGAGYRRAKAVCEAWMDSASHRANILNPDFTVIGAGYATGGQYGSYFVQVFGRER